MVTELLQPAGTLGEAQGDAGAGDGAVGVLLRQLLGELPHFVDGLGRTGQTRFLEMVDVVEQRPSAFPPRHAPRLAVARGDFAEHRLDDLRVVDHLGEVGRDVVEVAAVEIVGEDVVVQRQDVGAVAGRHGDRQLGLVFMQVERQEFDLDIGVERLEIRDGRLVGRRGLAVAQPDRQPSAGRIGGPGRAAPRYGQPRQRQSSLHRQAQCVASWFWISH